MKEILGGNLLSATSGCREQDAAAPLPQLFPWTRSACVNAEWFPGQDGMMDFVRHHRDLLELNAAAGLWVFSH